MVLFILMSFFILGASSPRRNSGVEAAAWKTLTIPAGVCIPFDDAQDYYSEGWFVKCDTTMCSFVCPFQFPTSNDVIVRRFIMMAYDNGSGKIGASLMKAKPGNAKKNTQATVLTDDSPSDPQTQTDTSIDHRKLTPYNGSYVFLEFAGSGNWVYGFKIKYTD
jgi:hypothetical protein